MNDYSFDYFNYITNIPDNPNTYIQNFNSGISNNFQQNNTPQQLTNPREGLERGNLFINLYEPYKNYKIENLKPQNEKDALLEQIMQYKFAITELNLYLDTHPNDIQILNLYQKYLEIEKQICNQYETMYGPLTINNIDSNNSWNWINNPWPWEVK